MILIMGATGMFGSLGREGLEPPIRSRRAVPTQLAIVKPIVCGVPACPLTVGVAVSW